MSVAAMIILSAFALLGMYYFVQMILEAVFCADIGEVVTVVPISSGELPLGELLRTVNGFSSNGVTVVVDVNGHIDCAKELVDKGLCCAVTEPAQLGEVLRKMIE